MNMIKPKRTFAKSVGVFALALAVAAPTLTYGDPPPQAPAHGWRKKNDPYYVGYSGKKWDRDYGIVAGTCNREAVGAVVGGVIGGAVGSTVGEGSARVVAIVVGSVLGAVVGGMIGRSIDDADRGCIGHALELGRVGQPVAWTNPQTGASYVVTPKKGFKQAGKDCREFTTTVTVQGRKETVQDRACRSGEGVWQIVG